MVRGRKLLEQQVGVERLAVKLAQAAQTPEESVPFEGSQHIGIRPRFGGLAVGFDVAQQRTRQVESTLVGRANGGQEVPSSPQYFFTMTIPKSLWYCSGKVVALLFVCIYC